MYNSYFCQTTLLLTSLSCDIVVSVSDVPELDS